MTRQLLYVAMTIAMLLSEATADPNPQLRLLPVPERVILNPGRFTIDGTFTVQLSGRKEPILARAGERFLQRLQKKTGIPFVMSASAADLKSALQVYCSGPGEPVQSLMADESYRLEVGDEGARLSASSPVGILRGMETFLQLVDLDGQSFFVPHVKIEDRPRFRWRGLHMDVSRHWEPVEIILRNLDAMAAVKMNVFHWHLSDDQGFRVESRKFPKLQLNGSDGNYYRQSEIREIVAYARDRGIRVIPEFDMPGHSSALLAAYPELASAPGPYEIAKSWGVFEPCLDPTRPEVYTFLDSFIGEMAGLFPDEYFHIGGDEVSEKQWNTSPSIRRFKARMNLKTNRELQAYFNSRLQKILAGHGKKMIGWDEILHPGLPQTVVVQSWRKQVPPAEAARSGYKSILSRGYYLDAMQPASFLYSVDPIDKAANLSTEESARIMGGEACMWAEFVNPDNIESRIWPRTAAIAERLWSPSGVADLQDMYQRLEYLNGELELLGLKYRANKEEMIQRIAGTRQITPLIILSEILVPAPFSARPHRKYSSLTPLNRMVDAVFPESEAARRFDLLIQQLLADPAESTDIARQIRNTLESWRENQDLVKQVLVNSFLLKEILPVSDTVAELCSRGLQAMDYLKSRQKAPEGWQKETADLLNRAEKPQAEMLPAIVGSIRKLVEAVDGNP